MKSAYTAILLWLPIVLSAFAVAQHTQSGDEILVPFEKNVTQPVDFSVPGAQGSILEPDAFKSGYTFAPKRVKRADLPKALSDKYPPGTTISLITVTGITTGRDQEKNLVTTVSLTSLHAGSGCQVDVQVDLLDEAGKVLASRSKSQTLFVEKVGEKNAIGVVFPELPADSPVRKVGVSASARKWEWFLISDWWRIRP